MKKLVAFIVCCLATVIWGMLLTLIGLDGQAKSLILLICYFALIRYIWNRIVNKKNKSSIKEIEINEEERWNNPMYNTEVIESKISILDKFERGELKFKNSSLDKDFTRLVVDKNKKKLAIDEYLEGKGTTYRLNPDDINIKDSKIIARKSQKKKTKGVEKASKIIAKIKKTENTKEEYFDNELLGCIPGELSKKEIRRKRLRIVFLFLANDVTPFYKKIKSEI